MVRKDKEKSKKDIMGVKVFSQNNKKNMYNQEKNIGKQKIKKYKKIERKKRPSQ